MSKDNFGGQGKDVLLASSELKAGMLLSIPQSTGHSPYPPPFPRKNDPVQTHLQNFIRRAKVEKSCYGPIGQAANWPSSFECVKMSQILFDKNGIYHFFISQISKNVDNVQCG